MLGRTLLTVAAVLVLPGTAFAYEDRASLGLEAGYGVVASDAPLPNHGFVAGFAAGFGLSDTWELRIDAAYSVHPDTLHRVRGAVEILYVIDILSVVPYVGLGAGTLISVLDGAVRPDFEGHAVVGFDVLIDRDWVVGLAVRPILLPTSIETDPFYLTITARAAVLVDL